jgi:hypothetical protein
MCGEITDEEFAKDELVTRKEHLELRVRGGWASRAEAQELAQLRELDEPAPKGLGLPVVWPEHPFIEGQPNLDRPTSY